VAKQIVSFFYDLKKIALFETTLEDIRFSEWLSIFLFTKSRDKLKTQKWGVSFLPKSCAI